MIRVSILFLSTASEHFSVIFANFYTTKMLDYDFNEKTGYYEKLGQTIQLSTVPQLLDSD
jgi:hypothetical protein